MLALVTQLPLKTQKLHVFCSLFSFFGCLWFATVTELFVFVLVDLLWFFFLAGCVSCLVLLQFPLRLSSDPKKLQMETTTILHPFLIFFPIQKPLFIESPSSTLVTSSREKQHDL